jgi:predicted short-subunit dehydrogenase-like oxidoreductase (DUF2520 family)
MPGGVAFRAEGFYDRRVPLRVLIFGPGRVGVAFARRLRAAGCDVLGFVGRDAVRTRAAVDATGIGAPCDAGDHARAHVVVFAVGDGDLAGAVAGAVAAAPPRPCSLWLHTSGRHGLEVFAGIPGIRRGALHPAAPVPVPAATVDPLTGAAGVCVGDVRSMRLLRGLCRRLGLTPVDGHGGDRSLYHAACALAANGLTGLFAAAADAVRASGVVGGADADAVVLGLMRGALAACAADGPVAALTGAVRRGDAAAVAAHLRALRAQQPAAVPVYLATAGAALALARSAGLLPDAAAAVAAVLEGG